MPTLTKNSDGSPHVHMYVRVANLDGTTDKNRYRCAHPDCTHWAYRNFLNGKRSICTICKIREIIMDYENLRRAHPSCFECGKGKKARAIREKYQQLNELFGDVDSEVAS